MPEFTTQVASTPEESFIYDEHRAINPEAMIRTLLHRSEGIAGMMVSASESGQELCGTQVALCAEQIQANIAMLSDVIEELLWDVDITDGVLSKEDVLRNMAMSASNHKM